MGLNGLSGILRVICALALVAPVAWAIDSAQANFGGADGFSGIGGLTCTSCHLPPHPTQDDAKAELEGLPESWKPGEWYPLTVRVTGGPTALPAPAPQGGFDMATDMGELTAGAGDEALLRNPSPKEITYTAEGTLVREWHVVWRAPGLESRPAAAHFWLAAIAANGNHVIGANMSDGGETFDSTAALTAAVPAHPDALEAWKAIPLSAPEAHATRATEGTWRIEGQHKDLNATAILFRLDGGAWTLRPTAASWRLTLPSDAMSFDYRADGDGRKSPVETLVLDGSVVGNETTPGGSSSRTQGAPLASWSLVPILALAAIRRKT